MSHKKKKLCAMNYNCNNCNKSGHESKSCDIPITSFGVILINVNLDLVPIHNVNNVNKVNKVNIYSSLSSTSYESCTQIQLENKAICSTILDSITFLMISRKHSLGYVEFIRGRYRVEKPMQIAYLFKLMTSTEIQKIKNSIQMEDGFDYLWMDLWGSMPRDKIDKLENNRKDAKSKYTMLKYIGVDGPEIGIEFMVNNIKAQFDINEWGFPKGRRHRNESDIDCAVREFMEETGYTKDDFKIVEQINPIVEEFLGTNGIKYRHIYYVAELVNKVCPKTNHSDEVGDITFMNHNTAISTIRPYHEEKKNIIAALTMYYFDVLYESMFIEKNS